MTKHKTLRQLCRVTDTPRTAASMRITSSRYYSPNDRNKEQWGAQVLNHAVDYSLLRDEAKGLLVQVATQSVREISEESIIALWQSIPREHQEKAVFLMNWATFDTLSNMLRNSPYEILTTDQRRGFCLLNKPIVLTNDMPCITDGAVPILYGDFGQVEVLQQGTDPMQIHENIAFSNMVECTQDGYAQVRLLDKQAVKGLSISSKEDTVCKTKSPSA